MLEGGDLNERERCGQPEPWGRLHLAEAQQPHRGIRLQPQDSGLQQVGY